MTVSEIINIGIVSQYKWAVSILKSGLSGGGTPRYLPQLLYSVRKNVEYRYNYEGITEAVSAVSILTVTSLGGAGTGYLFEYNDPDLGTIELGTYEESVSDTTTSILAQSISTILNTNNYGYSFTVQNNIITCAAPERLGDAANGTAVVCTITPAVVALSTISSPDASAAPSSGDSIMYILQIDNGTATSQTITNVKSYVRGTHVAGDFFSIDAYYNTSPTLSGSNYLGSVAPIDDNTTQYNISVTQAIASGATGYMILVLSVNSTPVAGHTGFINGVTDPVQLTITGTPAQTNSQTNSSGVVTIT